MLCCALSCISLTVGNHHPTYVKPNIDKAVAWHEVRFGARPIEALIGGPDTNQHADGLRLYVCLFDLEVSS